MMNSVPVTYAEIARQAPKPTPRKVPYLTGQQLLDMAEREAQGPITRSKSRGPRKNGQSPNSRAGKTRPVGVPLRVQHYIRHKEAADRNLGYVYRKYRIRNPKSVLTRFERRQVERDIEVRSDPGKVFKENCDQSWPKPHRAYTPPPETTYDAARMYQFISDCVDSVRSTTLQANLDRLQQMQIDDTGPSTSQQAEPPIIGL